MSDRERPTLGFAVGPQAKSSLAREAPIGTRERDDAVITILVPEPGQSWWAGGWYAPPADELKAARESLGTYRGRFDERGARERQRWPWRVRQHPATRLPAYLRGWLDEPVEGDAYADLAVRWLSAQDTARSLAGRDDLMAFFRPERGPEVVIVPPGDDVSGRPSGELIHVHWRQTWDGIPVLGGQLSVHLAGGDARASVTSNYVPVRQERGFAPALDPEEAVERARQALAHYASPDGPYGPEEALAALREGWASVAREDEQPLAVLPFAGDFRLIYRVYLGTPDDRQRWAVLVDAEERVVLGRPEALHYHARVFKSSQDVLDVAQSQGQPALTFALGGVNPAAPPCELFINEGGGRRLPGWVESALPQTDSAEFAANNVAVHARLMLAYLRGLAGMAPASPWPLRGGLPIEIEVGHNGNHRLVTYFRPGDDSTAGRIDFQTDDVGQGAARIRGLAYDPELIYHEVAHALLWTLNSDPFDHVIVTAPFARALNEGLATYVARSLGEQDAPSAVAAKPFAAAAYRAGEWQERWALMRAGSTPGQDYLPWPNLFPGDIAAGDNPDPAGNRSIVYDVGMVCARALWSLRTLFGQPATDRAVLDAFRNYARGWVTSFEGFAEGIIEHEQRADMRGPGGVIFAGRGILAGQGVQALAAAPDGSVVVAGDAGVMRLSPGGAWSDWGDLPGNGRLRDVVDLAVGEAPGGAPTLYAATEQAVFRRSAADATWSQVGPDLPLRPLCLAVAPNGDVFVGTGRDIRIGRQGGPTWQEVWLLNDLPGNPPPPSERLALDLAVSSPAGASVAVWAAGFNAVWSRVDGAASSTSRTLSNGLTDMVTCVLAAPGGAVLFIGSGTAGVWQAQRSGAGLTPPTQIARPADLASGAVLCLAGDAARLYAGTSAGVFVGTPAGAGGWAWAKQEPSPARGLPAGAVVTALAVTGGALYAGTALHGLWRLNNPTAPPTSQVRWARQPTPVASAIGVPEVPASGVLPVPAPLPQETLALPFFLSGRRRLRCNLGVARHIELWRLERGLTSVVDKDDGVLDAPRQPPGYYLLIIGRP
ncbi:MAG TPA: hypothetical protein PKD53_03705 [Chloroflexaceae bacterium]|nr:hypothetical protein [Chloroflexaceae bacterium]